MKPKPEPGRSRTDGAAEAALLELFANIVECSEDAIFSRRLDGTVTSWNRAAERMFGYSAREIVGRSSDVLLPPERTRETERLLARIARGARIEHLETERRNRKGNTLWVSLSLSPIRDYRGRIVGASTIARDISAVRELQAQLLAISEAERQRVGRDLHDSLGQQLSGMELLCRSLARQLEKRGLKEARTARLIAKQLQSTTGHTRALAHGLAPVLAAPNGLMMALEELAATTRSLFRIDCAFECEEPVLIAEHNAAVHLFRIAQEAVTNAVRHGRARRVSISLRRRLRNLALEIQDRGRGLTVPIPGHTGMGLRMMQYRTHILGGSLKLNNASPRGVLVCCLVPMRHLKAVSALSA